MIVSRTPLRISLGGGGTDLPFYAEKFGSSIACGAINKYVYITVSPRMDSKIKLNYSKTEEVDKVSEIEHPLIREAMKLVGVDGGINIHSVADIASGNGLGSSQSFLVGLLNALYFYKGETVSKYKLAEDASKITMETLQEPCGKQDQYAAAFGSIVHLQIDKGQRVRVSQINLTHEQIKELERNLMLFYTGMHRSANEILAEQKKIFDKQLTGAPKATPQIIEQYHRIQKIGDEGLKYLENGELGRFGALMDEHWKFKKSISGKMSNPEIDKWYEMAMQNGALGGKVIGAGGGGFMLFYVEKGHEKLAKLLSKEGLLYTPFKFDFDGSRIVYDGSAF